MQPAPYLGYGNHEHQINEQFERGCSAIFLFRRTRAHRDDPASFYGDCFGIVLKRLASATR